MELTANEQTLIQTIRQITTSTPDEKFIMLHYTPFLSASGLYEHIQKITPCKESSILGAPKPLLTLFEEIKKDSSEQVLFTILYDNGLLYFFNSR